MNKKTISYISIINIVLASMMLAAFVPVESMPYYFKLSPILVIAVVLCEYIAYEKIVSKYITIKNFVIAHVVTYACLSVLLMNASSDFHFGLFFLGMIIFTQSVFSLLQNHEGNKKADGRQGDAI